MPKSRSLSHRIRLLSESSRGRAISFRAAVALNLAGFVGVVSFAPGSILGALSAAVLMGSLMPLALSTVRSARQGFL